MSCRPRPKGLAPPLIADSAGVRDARRRLLSEQLVQEWGFDSAPKQRLSDAALRGWCGFVNGTLADLTAMHKAGIPILPGTDLSTVALFPGWSLHDELQTLVDGGVFSPADALRSATSLAARYAGQAEQVGTVETGKRADLLLLGADPSVSIAALRELEMVIVNGKVLDRATLLKLRGGVPLKYSSRGNAGACSPMAKLICVSLDHFNERPGAKTDGVGDRQSRLGMRAFDLASRVSFR